VTSGSPISVDDYDALRESLAESGALLGIPELHGGVSGALCAGGPAAAERWVDGFFVDHDAASAQSAHDVAHELVRSTWQRLEGAELAFEPLLPDDDVPIEEQVQALALWCHGFVNGLGASAPDLVAQPAGGGGRDAPQRTAARERAAAEVAEIVADFTEISRAGVEEEDRDNADFALAEIKEYARVSTQIVFENLAERRATAVRGAH
jgi:uncharacterized protein YgfB (UPF0149 family)